MAASFCVLEDTQKCNECGECDICDVNREKKCNNCMECIFDMESRFIKIDDVKKKKQ